MKNRLPVAPRQEGHAQLHIGPFDPARGLDQAADGVLEQLGGGLELDPQGLGDPVADLVDDQ